MGNTSATEEQHDYTRTFRGRGVKTVLTTTSIPVNDQLVDEKTYYIKITAGQVITVTSDLNELTKQYNILSHQDVYLSKLLSDYAGSGNEMR